MDLPLRRRIYRHFNFSDSAVFRGSENLGEKKRRENSVTNRRDSEIRLDVPVGIEPDGVWRLWDSMERSSEGEPTLESKDSNFPSDHASGASRIVCDLVNPFRDRWRN